MPTPNDPNILQRAGGFMDRTYDRINRPIYEPPIARGNAGGGILGAANRFVRGFGREVIPNTVPELVMGGLINPVRGARGGFSNAWQGSAYAQRRQYGRAANPQQQPDGTWFNSQFSGPPERLAGGEVSRSGPPRATRAPSRTANTSPVQAGQSGQTDPPETQPVVVAAPREQSMLSSMPRPIVAQRSGVGTRGGQTIATGRAAQNMVEGWQRASQQAILDEADRRWRERARMIEK